MHYFYFVTIDNHAATIEDFVCRYAELYQAGLEVSKLVAENFRLFFNIPLREPPPALEEAEGLEDELYEDLIPPPKEEVEEDALEFPIEEDQPAQGTSGFTTKAHVGRFLN